ncbi:Crp/Fnr family transcriptional regulator [Caulobacter sp. CCH9-E1]|uniref:Crp/Fnr family transcriptional regulator n=1 Tax=Caulobacter sp. CCH9-E1 TaxID=1768768 RepID=UPI000A4C04D8|nr:Crp/Fnr family transcriptional regulator [Caulobacter sp. CCH9-E1]
MKNRLLSALPSEDKALLAPYLTPTDLEKGRLLYDPGDDIDQVYFPNDGVISLMTLMESGAAIESATIGREGALGLMVAVAPRQSLSRAIVQAPGSALRIAAAPLHEAWTRSAALRHLVDRHNEALFGHAIQSVACNALHAVEARFCRWLLSCHDRIDSNTVSLTQEFLADMLGVQRTTVTAVAGSLQTKGLIRYRRGVVDILDRAGLEAMTCECYGAVRRSYERLLPDPFGEEDAPSLRLRG